MSLLDELLQNGLRSTSPRQLDASGGRSRQAFIDAGRLPPDAGESPVNALQKFVNPQIIDPAQESIRRAVSGKPRGSAAQLYQQPQTAYPFGSMGAYGMGAGKKKSPVLGINEIMQMIFGSRFS